MKQNDLKAKTRQRKSLYNDKGINPIRGYTMCKCFCTQLFWASLVAQIVKCLPTMQETWVWSQGQKDPLEKETATHSSILPGKPHGWRILVGYNLCCPKSQTRLSDFIFTLCTQQAAAAAKLLQLCPTLCNPIDRSLP